MTDDPSPGAEPPEPNKDEAIDSVKRSAFAGVRWVAVGSVLGEIIGVTSAVALARLVAPSGFGHAAVALLFFPLATILTFEGFASALVQRESIDADDRRTAVLMSLTGGCLLSGLLLATVPLLWQPIFGAETAQLIVLASPVFAISGVGAVSRAMLWRRLDFRSLTVIELAGSLVGSVVSVALALVGFGAKAIVLGSLASAAVGSALIFAAAPEPLPRWHRRAARQIGTYGVSAALAGLVGVLFSNIDYWILAARLSAHQTGIYYRAFNVGVVYQSKISNVMMQMAFPVYSRVPDRETMRALHQRAARVHAAVIFPLLALLIGAAPVAVPFVFGSVWRPAVVPSELLAVAGMVAAVLTGYPQVMLAVGRPQALVRFNILMVVGYGAAVALAANHGLVVISLAVIAAYSAILLGAYMSLLRPHLGMTLKTLIPDLAPALTGSACLLVVVEPLRMVLQVQVPPEVTLAALTATGLATYGAILRLAFPATWQDLGTLLVRVIPGIDVLRRRVVQRLRLRMA